MEERNVRADHALPVLRKFGVCARPVNCAVAASLDVRSPRLRGMNYAVATRSTPGGPAMQYEMITVTTADHVTRLTLNRPEVMNAINQRMHDEL